ncbi:MAG: PQQ-binding-like beta-propeller repeat protein [Anaerolineales bacterium]|nr:PQQ-binding-like beta-propeller repeat protein [Anaerolineales bacterium]
MKTSQFIFLITLVTLGSLLTACSGAIGTATSWPGLLVDADGETIYLAYSTQVFALNLANGAEKWRFPEKADAKVTFFAPPALTEDGQLLVGGYDKLLYSLDPQNRGAQNWVFDKAQDLYIASPLVQGENIFAPSADNSLYVLDLGGNLRWSYPTGHDLWATPVANGGKVYLPSMDHHLYAFDIASGERAWMTDVGGAMAGSPRLSPEGVLYVGTYGSEMIAIDAASGEILWRAPAKGWVWSQPLLQEGVLYFGDLGGALTAMNASDGSVLWQIQPDASTKRGITGAPLLLGDTLYFANKGGVLYAVDVANGNVRWSKLFEKAEFNADLVAAGDTILLAPVKYDAILIALDASGNQKWTFTPAK